MVELFVCLWDLANSLSDAEVWAHDPLLQTHPDLVHIFLPEEISGGHGHQFSS